VVADSNQSTPPRNAITDATTLTPPTAAEPLAFAQLAVTVSSTPENSVITESITATPSPTLAEFPAPFPNAVTVLSMLVNSATTRTTSLLMDVTHLANSSAVTETSKLEKNAISVLPTPTLPTPAEPTASSQFAVMVSWTAWKSVTLV